MQKDPPDEQRIYQLQNNGQQQSSQYLSPQASIQKSKKQYFYYKINLSILLVIMATISVQTQMQYYGPFVRTVQNFFNYHMLEHTSEDIYQGRDVIYYRTQQYFMAKDIMGFFDRYVDTMEIFRNDSFFFHDKFNSEGEYGNQIVKILIVSEVDDQQDQTLQKQLNNSQNESTLRSQIYKRDRILKTTHEKQQIVQQPINKIRQYFNLTVFNKGYYRNNLKKMQLQTNLNIKFKDHQNCTISVLTTCVFYSGMMMAVKVQIKVLDYEEETKLKSEGNQQFSYQNLGIRKWSEFHHMNFDFKYMAFVIFVVNGILFCIELMVVIRINEKIQRNLKEQKQFENKVEYLLHMQKLKTSPKQKSPHSHVHISPDSFFSQDSNKASINLLSNLPPAIKQLSYKQLSYKQRIQMIGLYNIIELVLSFLVMITVNQKGLVCLWCWTKMSIYLSQTGNRMMIGFLFKQAFPAYLKVIFNVLIWLSGFVFFSMVTYRNTMKFETVQLSYYEYFFNYFQYGIFENFRPIEKYGPMYSFLYFIHMAFLVMVGNNILQSILARQVLKNSNMKSLIEFIEGIEVECPVCGCPPEIKKKINIKMDKKTQRQNRFISQYFEAKKQASNKSKYQIQILSPEFSPMFHKQQYNNKEFKLRKFAGKNNQLLIEDFIANSPPHSPMALSPFYSPLNNGLALEKKKVKIQIGGDMQNKKMSKFDQYSKQIKAKSDIINKILHQLPKQHQKINSSISKYIQIQFLKKKLEEIKHLLVKIR